jgi:hypothetical protein
MNAGVHFVFPHGTQLPALLSGELEEMAKSKLLYELNDPSTRKLAVDLTTEILKAHPLFATSKVVCDRARRPLFNPEYDLVVHIYPNTQKEKEPT